MPEKRVRELFLAAIVVFIFLFFYLTLELFKYGNFSTWMVELCAGIIMAYAIANTRLKGKNSGIIARPGQYFVYLAWFYALVVGGYCFFHPTIEITPNIMRAVGEITVVFICTNYFNISAGNNNK
ncbi:hypothetical protein KKB69_02130 [Patescibacteria group bacterium]|nr:hypothetical protein [Patescibacteria group bacterium]